MDANPIQQFLDWFDQARKTEPSLPNAMTLATSGEQGQPSARMVLLKGVDQRGFVFFTHYESRKAFELKHNSRAALVFYWPGLARQVRVEGAVEIIEPNESDEYFATRPRGHQIEAHASPQSQIVKDLNFLEDLFDQTEKNFTGDEISRPLNWGGYRVCPECIEFWQEGVNRLHDRIRYQRVNDDEWKLERLAP
jgi:pyridoxamine 5'-phosphate oxidase